MRLTVNQLRRIIKEEVARVLGDEEAPEIDTQKAKDLATKILKANPEILDALASLGDKQLNKFVAGAEKVSEMPPEEIEAETKNVVSEAGDYVSDQDATIEFLGYLSAGGASIALALQQLYDASPAGMQRLADLAISHGVVPGSTQSKAYAIAALAAGIGFLGTAGIKALGLDGRYRINPRDYDKYSGGYTQDEDPYSSQDEEDKGMSESRRKTSRRGRAIREGTERLPEDYMAFCNAIQFIKDVGRSGQRDFPRDGHVYPITKQPMLDALKVISRTTSDVGRLVDPKTYNNVRFVDGALGDAKIIVTPASSLDYYDEMDRNYGNY